MDTAPLQPYRRTQLFKVPLSVELAETLVAVLILFAVPLFLLIQCAKKNKVMSIAATTDPNWSVVLA